MVLQGYTWVPKCFFVYKMLSILRMSTDIKFVENGKIFGISAKGLFSHHTILHRRFPTENELRGRILRVPQMLQLRQMAGEIRYPIIISNFVIFLF